MATTRLKVNRLSAIKMLQANRTAHLNRAKKAHAKLVSEHKQAVKRFEREGAKALADIKKQIASFFSPTTTYHPDMIVDNYRNGYRVSLPLKNFRPPLLPPFAPKDFNPAPVTAPYDRAIKMLELSQEDTVSVSYDDIGGLL